MKKLAAAVLLMAAWPCRGQQGTTGDLTGTVTSAGQPLRGVTITLTSNALQGVRTTTSAEQGGFRFTLLPPADYIVRFDMHGFTRAEERVHVTPAEVVRADVALIASPLREEIVVSPKGASTDAAIETEIGRQVLQQLPGRRDIRAATLLSPAVNSLGQRNGLVIAGAPSWDSLFLIDGIAAGEYLSGQPHDVVLEDAIQEVVVLTGAISAEYGRFTGGVVSTVTKSGGNEFSGSARDTMTNPAWTARTPYGGTRAAHRVSHGFEGTFGGFLVKDRLWFFGGLRNARITASRFTYSTNIPYANVSLDRRGELKLTDRLTAGSTLVASYSDAKLDERNALDTRGGSNVLDLASLIPHRQQSTRLLAATYDVTLTANTIAELQYSQKKYALRGNGGTSADPILGTLISVFGGGNLNAPVGCGICGDDERDSRSIAAKTSMYRNTRWGIHTAIIGGEGFRETRSNAATRSASNFNIRSGAQTVGQSVDPTFNRSTAIGWTQPFPGNVGSRMTTVSGYANDRWDLGSRATVNLGVRYDRNNDRDAAGRLISNDAAWSPRLSAMFDVSRNGAHQLLAGFGRYDARMLESGGGSQQVGTFNQFGWNYGGPPITGLPAHEALAALFAWFNANGGTDMPHPIFVTTPDTSNVFHGSLQSPSVDERTLGYAMRMRSGEVRADLIARDWHHFYASRIDHTTGQTVIRGSTVDLAWVVNDNSETKRRYRALQLRGSWQWKRISAGAGYVLSTLRGNDDEEDGASLNAPRNLPLSLWYPELLGYPQRRPFGYLRQDERHRLRAWLQRDFGPFAVMLVQRFDSGSPYSAVATINVANLLPTDGYSESQLTPTPYYIGARGRFRAGDVFSTDASIQYAVPFRGARLFAKADVLNLLNNHAVVAPDTTVTATSFDPFTTNPIAGVNYRLGDQFGKAIGPDAYQTPRTFQIAVGARF